MKISLLRIISESPRKAEAHDWPTDPETPSSLSQWTDLSEMLIFCSFAVDSMEGEALVIKCPEWSSSVKVTWYRVDTNKTIPAEEEGSRVFSTERFLWFLPTSREDSGNYTCVTHL